MGRVETMKPDLEAAIHGVLTDQWQTTREIWQAITPGRAEGTVAARLTLMHAGGDVERKRVGREHQGSMMLYRKVQTHAD